MTMTRRRLSWTAAIAAGTMVTAPMQPASIGARALVRATQFDGYVAAAYDGKPCGLVALTVVTSDPADPVRHAEAGVALNELCVGTYADGSATQRPDGYAHRL